MKNGLQKITALFMAVLMLLTCFCAGALGDEQYSDSVTPGIGLYSILDPEETSAATYIFLVGETEYARQTVKNGEILYEPTAPTAPENAVFRGWYTDSDELFTGFGAQNVTQTQTIRLTARFEVAYYVYFYTPDGTMLKHTEVVTDPQKTYDFSGVTYEAGSTKKVTGWSATKGGTTDISHAVSLNGQSSISLYAIETDGYWVIFHTGEGSVIAPVFLAEGDTLGLVGMSPVCDGYLFGGWYDNEECTGDAVTSVSAAAELYAKWIPTTVNYTVIHWWENADDDNYSFHESGTKTGLTEAQTAAAAKTYPGFTAQEIEQQTIQGNGSTIVNVYYKRNVCYVKFYTQTGRGWREDTSLQITAKYGANIKDKWPGGSWYVSRDPNNGVMQAGLEVMPLNGMNFYGKARGASKAVYYYVEVIPGEDGTLHNGIKYKLDHTDYWPSGSRVTKEDYYAMTGFTFYEGSALGTIESPIQFYYTRNSYKIVFISNGVPEKESSYKYEQPIDNAYYEPAEREGYTFAGWYDNELGEGKRYDFEGKTMPANNITLYAKWVPKTYTVSFDLGYEGAVGAPDDQTVAYKQKAAQPETPVREGFTFTGWYDEYGKLFSFETPIVKNTKLTARWLSSSEFKVIYDKNGGSGKPPEDSTSYAEGAKATVADKGELISPSQKVFLGWAKSAEATKADYQPGDAMEIRAADANDKNEIYLYAVWGEQPQTTKLVYNLNYIAEGESEAQTFYHEENGSADLPNNAAVSLYGPEQSEKLTRPGYTLLGWAKTAEAQTPDYSCGQEIMLDQNNDDQENVLYAVWKRSAADVTITKTVTGNFGDKQKAFAFTVSSTEAVGSGEGYTLSQDAKEISFNLSHEQSVTIRNVPIGASLTLSEEAPGYTVSVKVNGAASDSTIVVREGVNAIEVVNFRDVVPDTGVGLDSLPYILILAAVLGLGALMLVLRRRSRG